MNSWHFRQRRRPGGALQRWAVLSWLVVFAGAAEPVPRTFDDQTRTAPPAFTATDAATLERTSAALRRARDRLQREKLPTAEQATLAAQVQSLARQTQDLLEQRAAWEAFRGPRDTAAAGVPSLERANAAAPLDRQVLTGLFERYFQLDRRRSTANPTAAGEWEELARDFAALHTVKFVLTARDPAAPYVLRAMLLEGQCQLFAAVEHHRAGNGSAFERTYEEGLRRLDLVVRLLASAVRLQEETAALEKLPLEPAAVPLALVGVLERGDTLRIQPATSERARRVLADFCPWGYQVWAILRDAGIGRALDPTVLRPFTDQEPQRIAISSLAEPVVPAFIRRDLEAVRSGRVPVGKERLDATWRSSLRPSYSLWVMSPAVYDLPASEKVAWALRAVKLAREGWVELVWDEAKDMAMTLVSHWSQEQGGVYYFCGALKGLDDYGFGHEFYLRGERFSRYELAKELFHQSVRMSEDAEVERLFGGIDPKDTALRDAIGWAKTYTGEPMPLVLLRADFLAERTLPELRYRQIWHFVSFYNLNPSGLLDRGDRYDLSQQAEFAARQRAAYLQGDERVERATWRQLPDTPKPWGTRLYVTDLTPSGQALALKFADATRAKWRQGMKPDEVLVAQLWTPAPNARCLVTAEIDRPELVLRVTNASRPGLVWPLDLRFHGREVATRELCTEYTVKVGVAGRAALRAAGDPPPALIERDATTLRFVAREGEPVTGTLSVPTTTEPMTQAKSPNPAFVQLTFDWDQAARPHFDVDPKGHDWPLLPPRVAVEGVTGPATVVKSGQVRPSSSYYRTIEFSASITPVEPGWHEVTVEIAGRPYRVWSLVAGRGTAAIFKATLPVPVGEAAVLVRAKNAAPVQFKSYREPHPSAASLDTGRWLRTVEEYAQRVAQATRVDQRMRALNESLDKQVAFASTFLDADLPAQARPLLQQVLRQWPSQGLQAQGDPRSGPRIWSEDLAYLHECLLRSCFLLGDTAGLVASTRAWFTERLRSIELSARESNQRPVGYYAVASRGADWIQMCIQLGAPPADLREVIALYGRARQADGFYRPPYDEFEFVFPPEGS